MWEKLAIKKFEFTKFFSVLLRHTNPRFTKSSPFLLPDIGRDTSSHHIQCKVLVSLWIWTSSYRQTPEFRTLQFHSRIRGIYWSTCHRQGSWNEISFLLNFSIYLTELFILKFDLYIVSSGKRWMWRPLLKFYFVVLLVLTIQLFFPPQRFLFNFLLKFGWKITGEH